MNHLAKPLLAAAALAAALGVSPARAAIPTAEREALLSLYRSTDGPNWRNSTKPWTGVPGTECSWHGVTCGGAAGSEHVTALKLNFNDLTGTVPALHALTELTSLNLYQNSLSGPIPPLAGLSKLVTVSLGQNQFSGSIPSLAGLSQLEEFEVRGGQLTGSTPDLSSLTRLKVFNVGGNTLDGQIGPLAGATALQDVILYTNQLSGPIPDLTGLPALRTFDASNNRLSAMGALAGLANLVSFNASYNLLSGPMVSLAGLSKLTRLGLQYNQLSGPIPPLDDLVSLEDLNLRNNQLTGQIPPSLSALTRLRLLNLQNNQLVGSPPMPPNATLTANMCPNPLRNSPDAAINAAWDPRTGNGRNPWATGCTGSWDVTPLVRDASSGEIIADGSTGTIAPSSVQILPRGGGAAFTMTPAAGFTLRTTTDTNCPGSRSGNVYTVANIQANCYINAVFVPAAGPDWQVTAIVDGGGGSAAPATQNVANGSRATVTATPEPSYMLFDASGCGATFVGNGVTTAPVTANCTVTLRFALAEATTTQFVSVAPAAPHVGEEVTVSVAAEVGDTPLTPGTVTVSGGGASCAASLDAAGHGQCTLRFPSAGTHQLTAAYPGDPARRYQPSSAVQAITVAAAPGGVQAVPTLGQWSLVLLAALLALMALRRRA